MRPRWADLPPDLLRYVSDRLHRAIDFVRFHAVCKPWRAALLSLTVRPTFQPWLLAPCDRYRFKLRCVFSRTSYRAAAPAGRFVRRNWVAGAGGVGAWFFVAGPDEPMLVDPLTGAATPLPPLPDEIAGSMENPHGIVYGDGTTLLYSFYRTDGYTSIFRVAILRRPGDTTPVWTVVERALHVSPLTHRCCVAYHDGEVLVCVDLNLWCVLAPPGAAEDDMPGRRWLPDVAGELWRKYSYVLESRGELLWASVLVQWDYDDDDRRQQSADGRGLARALSVTVHALEAYAGGETRWARRDGRSLGDRVLFLGCPSSFAVDAAQFGAGNDVIDGGCAYFVHKWEAAAPWPAQARERCGVFRHNLVAGETKFVEWLAPDWDADEACVWLLPQPTIAPIHESIDRIEVPNRQQQEEEAAPIPRNIIRMARRPQQSEQFFSFFVHNLPPRVDSSRLHRFFDEHGKVAAAEVISPGVGRVTMATVDGQADAEAALSGLVMDGCIVGVNFVKKRRRRRR